MQSPTDPCVLRKIVDGKVCLLLVDVDDILVIAERVEIERLQQRFVEEFTWITIDIGKKHSYLGMLICFEDGCVLVDMIHYISKMLDAIDGLAECSVPANKKILAVDEQSPLLTEKEWKQHSSGNFHFEWVLMYSCDKGYRGRQEKVISVAWFFEPDSNACFEASTA